MYALDARDGLGVNRENQSGLHHACGNNCNHIHNHVKWILMTSCVLAISSCHADCHSLTALLSG
jgi:hypothetical protein